MTPKSMYGKSNLRKMKKRLCLAIFFPIMYLFLYSFQSHVVNYFYTMYSHVHLILRSLLVLKSYEKLLLTISIGLSFMEKLGSFKTNFLRL